MHMDMEHRLPGSGTNINADIEAGDSRVFFFDCIFQDPDQVVHIVSLGFRKPEIIFLMPPGDHQVVPGRDRRSIQNGNRTSVCVYDLSG